MDEDTRNPVEVLAEEFVDRYRRGESPSVQEYVERHPEHAEEITDVFEAALLVERLKRGTGWPASPAAGARDPMPTIVRFGDYRVVREVGRGGMGVVYEAEQEALRRRVALKVLVPWAMGSSGRVERFRREAQAAANLHHTNIVQVFGVGEQDGLHFYVMQLIDGPGLDALIADPAHTFDDRRAAEVALQVAHALSHAHEQGVLHRDVKPANVLLDERGTAWITDFGLAKVLLDPNGLTEAGDLIGTIRYMPPERFEGRSDARGDVYGLGLVLYELLTGRPAYAEQDQGSLISAVRKGKTAALRSVVPDVPMDLATIVDKTMAPNPDDRYPTTAAVAEDLERFLDDRPILARRIGLIERSRRWCRRNKALAAVSAVAAGAVLLAAVTGWIGFVVTQDALERESEGRTRAEAATRRAVTNERMSLDALEGIFDSLAGGGEGPPPPGPDMPPEAGSGVDTELLQTVLAFYDRFADENETNPRLRRESARAHLRVGSLHAQAGDTEAAAQAFSRAATSFEAMRTEYPEDPENTRDLARTLSEAAMWSAHAGSLDAATRDAERAVALLLGLGADDLDGARNEPLLATARCRLALVQASRGDEAEARATLALMERDRPRRPAGPTGWGGGHLDVALVYRTLAARAVQAGRDGQGLDDLDTALTVLREGRGAPPPPQAIARVQRERAAVLRRLGRTEEAERAEADAQAAGRNRPPRRPR